MQTRSLRTSDVDLARSEVTRLFCPHRLTPTRRGVDVRLSARRGERAGVVQLDYGRPVHIEPGELERFYLVQIPLAGAACIRHQGREFVSTPQLASVLSPDDPVDMAWGAGNPQLICWLARSAVEERLAAELGEPVSGLRFAPALDVTSRAGRRWAAAVQRCARAGSLIDEDALVLDLLAAQPHSHLARLRAARATLSSARRAMAYMDEHLAEPLTLPRVAEATGVGVRALQKAFRHEVDATPMEWLRDLRLDRAHELLLASSPGSTTVTEVAVRLGVPHLGRFSAHYRARFGEPPSQTLADPSASAALSA